MIMQAQRLVEEAVAVPLARDTLPLFKRMLSGRRRQELQQVCRDELMLVSPPPSASP